MKRPILALLMIILLSLGCTDRDDELDTIQIRVKNNNDFVYQRVTVGGAENVYENIGPGDYSEYLIYDEAYRYASINIEGNGQTYTLQPIDFVGETPLGIGFYTYELTANESGMVDLDFIIE